MRGCSVDFKPSFHGELTSRRRPALDNPLWLVANAGVQELGRHHIDAPAVEQFGKLTLDVDEAQAGERRASYSKCFLANARPDPDFT
jgi:hypothetical protein